MRLANDVPPPTQTGHILYIFAETYAADACERHGTNEVPAGPSYTIIELILNFEINIPETKLNRNAVGSL